MKINLELKKEEAEKVLETLLSNVIKKAFEVISEELIDLEVKIE